MIKRISILSAVALATGLIVGQASPPTDADSATRVTPKLFAQQVAATNLYEIKASEWEADKGQNQQVKDFAGMVSQSHNSAQTDLKAIATAKNIDLPDGPTPVQQAKLDKLQTLTGTDLDKQYVSDQVRVHRRAMVLYQDQSQNGTDPEIKAFASRQLPTIQKHMQTAQQLQSTIGGGSGADGAQP